MGPKQSYYKVKDPVEPEEEYEEDIRPEPSGDPTEKLLISPCAKSLYGLGKELQSASESMSVKNQSIVKGIGDAVETGAFLVNALDAVVSIWKALKKP